jgi:hypothetical protein
MRAVELLDGCRKIGTGASGEIDHRLHAAAIHHGERLLGRRVVPHAAAPAGERQVRVHVGHRKAGPFDRGLGHVQHAARLIIDEPERSVRLLLGGLHGRRLPAGRVGRGDHARRHARAHPGDPLSSVHETSIEAAEG